MNKTQIKKKGDQMLEHLNDLVVDRFESIRAMETALNQKDQADDFDKREREFRAGHCIWDCP